MRIKIVMNKIEQYAIVRFQTIFFLVTMMPDMIGQMFSADVIRRGKQMILVVLETFPSFVFGMLIPSKKHEDLHQGPVQLVTPLMNLNGCTIRVDNTLGFFSIKN